jgi:hypothetical protein
MSLIRGVLLAGNFRTQHELNGMSNDDQRNTLIVELTARTNQSVGHFQGMDDATLAGTGAVLVFLRRAKIRTDEQLKTISDDDQRNILIVEIDAQTGLGARLQGLSNLDLVLVGLGSDLATKGVVPGEVSSFIRGVLLAGQFRTQQELDAMSDEDQRNTLIVELAGRTNQTVGHFQAMNDDTLAGTGAVLVFLREAKIRTDEQLKTISDDDQRNILIVEIDAQTGLGARLLQSLSNMDLVLGALGVPLNPFNEVHGTSKGGDGVFGESKVGVGVHGKGGRLAGFFEGDVEVKGDILLTNADLAEDFDIADSVEPGTVMVLNQEGALRESHQAYDKRVAGVVSGAGRFKPGIVLDRHQSQPKRLPIALLGKVYCKVEAQSGPIEVGDLLTTSGTPGHAMKAGDPGKAFGAVIGKAMQPWPSGQGYIPILIALQ